MTQKNKELLLKDLCARVPYGIICKCTYPVNNETTDGEDVLFTNDYEIEGIRRVGAGFAGDRRWYEITFDGETYSIDDEGIKVVPYLRPMSSMTQKEIDEYDAELDKDMDVVMDGALDKDRHITSDGKHNFSKNFVAYFGNDWLNAHHFDYRGLIEKGLALEAPEGMYDRK